MLFKCEPGSACRFIPDVCCVYSSILDRDAAVNAFWGGFGQLWTLRWVLFVQALRAGYNMLHVDNDVMFTTDIYRYFPHSMTAPSCMAVHSSCQA